MSKAVKIRCHNQECREIFHLPIARDDDDVVEGSMIRRSATCPFCSVQCVVEVQARSGGESTFRDDALGIKISDVISGSFREGDATVYESEPPPPTENPEEGQQE